MNVFHTLKFNFYEAVDFLSNMELILEIGLRLRVFIFYFFEGEGLSLSWSKRKFKLYQFLKTPKIQFEKSTYSLSLISSDVIFLVHLLYFWTQAQKFNEWKLFLLDCELCNDIRRFTGHRVSQLTYFLNESYQFFF